MEHSCKQTLEAIMKTRILAAFTATLAAVTMAGCENMTRQEKATAAGAVVGGVVGSAATDGSTLGTVGGAVAGGVIGNEVGKRY
jgi:osmotically inducible lipoprotein OsmB